MKERFRSGGAQKFPPTKTANGAAGHKGWPKQHDAQETFIDDGRDEKEGLTEKVVCLQERHNRSCGKSSQHVYKATKEGTRSFWDPSL
ncbi:hypothetical protein [Geobacillus icigianus]|uniref:hypothetical protein n=1 Tax=Geobacillus icigianus TaxID=1430331 RepID=UPI000508BC4F|nr:hypothetical protein [Geobacillus icigianus]